MRYLFYAYANIKGAAQPVFSSGLISAFVVHCLDRIVFKTSRLMAFFLWLSRMVRVQARWIPHIETFF